VISKSRNVIQNGNFDVWQRGTTFTGVASTTYVADRWKVLKNSDGVFDVLQNATNPNNASLYNLQFDVTTADGTVGAANYIILQHAIEGNFFMSVRDKPMTLSFWTKAKKTGINCIALLSSAGDETFIAEYTVNTTATWEKKVIQIPPIPAGTWGTGTGIAAYLRFCVYCGSTSGDGAVGWQAAAKISTANQVNNMDSTDNYVQYSQVQLEAGSSATEFEVMDPTDVLSTCQRYLVTHGGGTAYDRVGGGFLPTSAIASVVSTLPTTMRATPTIGYDAVGSWCCQYGSNQLTACTAIAIQNSTTKVLGLNVTGTLTPFTTGEAFFMSANNTTAARLYVSSEI